jgi:hypothetical protein
MDPIDDKVDGCSIVGDQSEDEVENEVEDEEELAVMNMLITAEDVSVLVDRCGDVSLAARKQALASLTELVLARPADANLQVLLYS